MKTSNDILAEIRRAQRQLEELGPPPIHDIRIFKNEWVQRGHPIMSCHPDDFDTLTKALEPKETSGYGGACIDPKVT